MPEACKVFLSSTEADLGAWRDAAADALAAIGVDVVRMEYDWAGATSPAETCRNKLLLARIVIALIGFHYGSHVPGDPGKRSFTQLEFDTAVETGMDLLPYVVPPKFIADTGETGAKRDLQIAFRERVEENHTCGRLPREEDWRDPYRVAVHLVRKVFRRCYPEASDRDEYAAQLKVSVLEKEAAAAEAPPGEREILLKEKAAVEAKLANLEAAYAEAEKTIAGLREAVGRYGNDLGSERLARAEAALDEKDFDTADALLKEIEEAGELEVLRVANAAFQRGKIAEEQVRWHDALTHFEKAARLAPNYERLREHWDFLWKLGFGQRAVVVAQDLEEAARSEFGEESAEFGATLSCRAVSLRMLGRFAEAEPLYRHAIETTKAALGETHADYATSLNNLAGLLRARGRRAEAEPLYRQAIEIDEAALGDSHPGYATDLNNLAELLRDTGRHAEAEPLYRQAMEIRRAALGEAHPNYAQSLNNLALLLRDTGRYAESEPLCRQAIEIGKATLGEAHPAYATSLNNLAGLLQDMGRHAEAEPLFRQATATTKAALGEAHPAYATHLNNLAGLLQAMGRLGEAEPLYRQATATIKATLGEAHPAYATRLNNLAGLLRDMGRHAEARPMYSQMMPILRKALGDEHPNTKAGAANYARLLREHFPDDPALAELEAAFGPEIGR